LFFILIVKSFKAKNIISFFLILTLVFPTAIQFDHSFENHIDSKTTKEGYNKAVNSLRCTIFHQLFLIKSTLSFNSIEILSFPFFKNLNFKTSYLKVTKYSFSIYTRGPPSLNI